MSALNRLMIFASVVAISSAQTAIAAEAADPFADETPLTKAELSEARGGFNVGGFHFDFGVTIHPIDVSGATPSHTTNSDSNDQPNQHDSMFGEDGLFGKDGVLGNGGVFGGKGVFGDKNSSDANSATSAPATNNDASSGAPAVTPAAPPPPAPANMQESVTSPSIQNAAGQSSSGSTPGSADAPVSSSASGGAPTEKAGPALAQNQSPGSGFASPGAPNVSEENSSPAKQNVAAAAPAGPTSKPASSNESPGSQASAAASSPKKSEATLQGYMVASGENTFIINNTLNNKIFSQRIDINVTVPNFREAVAMATTAQVVSRIATDPIVLGALRMH